MGIHVIASEEHKGTVLEYLHIYMHDIDVNDPQKFSVCVCVCVLTVSPDPLSASLSYKVPHKGVVSGPPLLNHFAVQLFQRIPITVILKHHHVSLHVFTSIRQGFKMESIFVEIEMETFT